MHKIDGWAQILGGLNTSIDKRRSARVDATMPLSVAELSDLYRGSDIAAMLVDLPVEEQTREGWEVKTGDDTQEVVENFLDDLNVESVFFEAMRDARLYGSSIVLMGADDGNDPTLPLDLSRVRTLNFLTPIDRYSLGVAATYDDPLSPEYKKPALYEILSDDKGSKVLVHASRVLRFDGVRLPRRMSRFNHGFGDSVLQRVYEICRDYDISFQAVSYLLQDFSQLVIRIRGLREALALPDGAQYVRQRMQIIEQSRSVIRGVLLDENEEYDRKNVSFAGVPEVLEKFMLRLSQATRIPATLLMGRSPAGLNATGDSDFRGFANRMAAEQRKNIRPELNKLLRVVFAAKNGPTGGIEPESWSVIFRPIWQLSELERADLYEKTSRADATYIGQQVLDPSEVAASAFSGEEFSTIRKIDLAARAMQISPDTQAEPQTDPQEDPNAGV